MGACVSLEWAQRKIPVVLSFPYHRHKAGGASPLGVARAACFEQLAGVFASCGALNCSLDLASDDVLVNLWHQMFTRRYSKTEISKF